MYDEQGMPYNSGTEGRVCFGAECDEDSFKEYVPNNNKNILDYIDESP